MTVISNVMPSDPKKARDFEVVLRESPRAGQKAPPAYRREATPTEQALLNRIETLEREFQNQQYPQYPQTVISSAPQYQGYYAPPSNAVVAAYPYPDSYSYYPDGYFSTYYPSYVFPYPYYPYYSSVGRTVVAHRFAHAHGGFNHARPAARFAGGARPGGRR